jgi:hypothetical protein
VGSIVASADQGPIPANDAMGFALPGLVKCGDEPDEKAFALCLGTLT